LSISQKHNIIFLTTEVKPVFQGISTRLLVTKIVFLHKGANGVRFPVETLQQICAKAEKIPLRDN